jgi:hypothetical protein
LIIAELAEQIARFRRVWWIHTGLYAGLVAGLAAMIIGAARQTATKALSLN